MQCVNRAGPSRIWVTLRPLPLPEEQILFRDLETVEFQFAMAAVLLGSHDRDAAEDAPARLIACGRGSAERP